MTEEAKGGHILKGIVHDMVRLVVIQNCAAMEQVLIRCRSRQRVVGSLSNFTRLPNIPPTSTCVITQNVVSSTTYRLVKIVWRELEALMPAPKHTCFSVYFRAVPISKQSFNVNLTTSTFPNDDNSLVPGHSTITSHYLSHICHISQVVSGVPYLSKAIVYVSKNNRFHGIQVCLLFVMVNFQKYHFVKWNYLDILEKHRLDTVAARALIQFRRQQWCHKKTKKKKKIPQVRNQCRKANSGGSTSTSTRGGACDLRLREKSEPGMPAQ